MHWKYRLDKSLHYIYDLLHPRKPKKSKGEESMNRSYCFWGFLFVWMFLCLTTSPHFCVAATVEYANPDLLVSTEWLQSHMVYKDLMIIDARLAGYAQAHVPGAVCLDYKEFRTERSIRPVQELQALLSSAGLRNDMTIVVYDDGGASHGAAGWFFWMLEYVGCKDVHMLNGGFDKWASENRPTGAGTAAKRPGKFIAAPNEAVLARLNQVLNSRQNGRKVLIDTRGDAEYNGWPLDGVARAGHIPEALNIDYAWFYAKDKTILNAGEIKTLLQQRNITPEKDVIVYGSTGPRAGFSYFVLRLMGYLHVSNYDGSVLEWSLRTDLPMDRLARYEKLVYASWVKDLLDGKKPYGYSGKRFVILESRYTGFSTSQPGEIEQGASYIPGAIVVHPCYFENGNDTSKYYPKYSTPADGNLMPDEKLQKAIEALGITKDTTVVVYGNGKIIPMTSARVAWALMYAGVEDVRILNGGFTAWVAEGYPVAATPAPLKPVADFGAKVPVHPEYLATTDQVRQISEGKNKTSVLVDVRKIQEYVGEECPYPFFAKKGHIPGAIWNGDYWVLVDKNDDTWRSYSEIQHLWSKLGITSAVEPVFYCGTAWRSAVGFFHAYLMGYDRLRNYDDSFYGWSFDPKNPLALNAPK
jgi:3-mercaptopyruvate sulfurtransferase SseA